MESYESILESEWSALNAMHSTEESDFMAQLLNYCSIPNDLHNSGSQNTDVHHFPGGTNFYHLTSDHDSYYAGNFDHMLATYDVHENMILQLEQEDQVLDSESNKDAVFRNPLQKSKKRTTNSREVQKNKRNVKAKKKQRHTKTSCINKERNGVLQKPSSSSCSSENDSTASHELSGVASNSSESKEARTINSNGQPRAVRGSATDPQSLYARKRRERINERLRTLQNLVPNGTKVDISTMLEDAVEYVKFLQLQIKLLSSDDKWMYAPIAYNGTDVRT